MQSVEKDTKHTGQRCAGHPQAAFDVTEAAKGTVQATAPALDPTDVAGAGNGAVQAAAPALDPTDVAGAGKGAVQAAAPALDPTDAAGAGNGAVQAAAPALDPTRLCGSTGDDSVEWKVFALDLPAPTVWVVKNDSLGHMPRSKLALELSQERL